MRFTSPDVVFANPSFQKFGWSLAQRFHHLLCTCPARWDCDPSRLQGFQKRTKGRYYSKCQQGRVLPLFHNGCLAIPRERTLDTWMRLRVKRKKERLSLDGGDLLTYIYQLEQTFHFTGRFWKLKYSTHTTKQDPVTTYPFNLPPKRLINLLLLLWRIVVGIIFNIL